VHLLDGLVVLAKFAEHAEHVGLAGVALAASPAQQGRRVGVQNACGRGFPFATEQELSDCNDGVHFGCQ
jgi:hypothetical protein